MVDSFEKELGIYPIIVSPDAQPRQAGDLQPPDVRHIPTPEELAALGLPTAPRVIELDETTFTNDPRNWRGSSRLHPRNGLS